MDPCGSGWKCCVCVEVDGIVVDLYGSGWDCCGSLRKWMGWLWICEEVDGNVLSPCGSGWERRSSDLQPADEVALHQGVAVLQRFALLAVLSQQAVQLHDVQHEAVHVPLHLRLLPPLLLDLTWAQVRHRHSGRDTGVQRGGATGR